MNNERTTCNNNNNNNNNNTKTAKKKKKKKKKKNHVLFAQSGNFLHRGNGAFHGIHTLVGDDRVPRLARRALRLYFL